jgi:micrococcal nuclease
VKSGVGSALLLVLVALVLLRPWEGVDFGDETPRSASALVTRVVDGDTVEVRLGGEIEDVRYIGVDTPETAECFSARASAFNARLVEDRQVRLERDAEERDRYGRLLAYVHRRSDGLFVNLALVEDGFAAVATYPPNVAHRAGLAAAAAEAREAGRGLWQRCGGPDVPAP